MFSTTGLTESEITSQLRVAMFCPVRWCRGVQVDDSAPEFLITPQMPSSKLCDKVLLAPKVMIGDLGQGRCFHFQYCYLSSFTDVLYQQPGKRNTTSQ